MLEIRKGSPWIFWPSSICDSLPEKPANKFLNGNHSYSIDITLTLLDDSNLKKTIFSILPKYTGIDIDKENITLLVNQGDNTDAHILPKVIYPYKKTNIILKYIYSEKMTLTINGILVKEISLTKPIGFDEHPHIIFGAGNFPKNGFNLNYTDIDIHEFKFFVEDELVSHHDFEEFIFDKSVDKTENCNFIHKL